MRIFCHRVYTSFCPQRNCADPRSRLMMTLTPPSCPLAVARYRTDKSLWTTKWAVSAHILAALRDIAQSGPRARTARRERTGLVTSDLPSDHLHCAPPRLLGATLARLLAVRLNKQACRCSLASCRVPGSPRNLPHCFLVLLPTILALLSAADSTEELAATAWAVMRQLKKRTKACSLWKKKTSSRAHPRSLRSLLLVFCLERARPLLDLSAGKEPSKRKKMNLLEGKPPVNICFGRTALTIHEYGGMSSRRLRRGKQNLHGRTL